MFQNYLFDTGNGDRIVETTLCALLDEVVVDLAGAEDEALGLGGFLAGDALLGDDASEGGALGHLGPLRAGLGQPEQRFRRQQNQRLTEW